MQGRPSIKVVCAIVRGFIKAQLRKVLTPRQRRFVKALIHRNDLSALARAFGTDKQGTHAYARHYERHFVGLRHRALNILEIGIGGYENPRAGGESLRVWKAYFPKSRIFGIDLYDKTALEEPRIKTFRGSQADPEFLRRVVQEIGDVDIVVDDGSHQSEHVTSTFRTLFPLLSRDGLYVVEDLQTSYWTDVAGRQWGGSEDLSAPQTSMNFFKSLVDGLNYEEFMSEQYQPTYFDRHIVAMHFYHNLLFVQKGLNEGGSNMLGRRFGDARD